MSQINKSPSRAKQRLLKKGCTVNEIKGELRRRFNNRIKDIRNNLLDSHRNINEKELIDRGYNEIRDLILSDTWDNNEFSEAAVLKVLSEVQEELEEYLERSSQEYYEQIQKETDSIVENLYSCRICDTLLENNTGEICFKCMQEHFSD